MDRGDGSVFRESCVWGATGKGLDAMASSLDVMLMLFWSSHCPRADQSVLYLLSSGSASSSDPMLLRTDTLFSSCLGPQHSTQCWHTVRV